MSSEEIFDPEKSVKSDPDPDPSVRSEGLPNSYDIVAAAADPSLTEDLALKMLKQTELRSEVFERLRKNAAIANSRKVKIALLCHAKTPRHVALPLLPHLFTFDLMQIALQPVVPPDIKVAAENALIQRLDQLSTGEKLSLARRASGRVAARLLTDPEMRVVAIALENARLTEASILKTISMQEASRFLIDAISRHPKWSLRQEIRWGLLRNEYTSEDRALEFATDLPSERLREMMQHSGLPEHIKSRLLQQEQ